MSKVTVWSMCVMMMAVTTSGCAAGAASPAAPKATDRIVTLGDSITDGCTYPQLLTQALTEAGKPTPTIICAGVVCDTAERMAARLDKDVLSFKPDVVTFSAGTNDSLGGISPARYEKALREISAKVRAAGGTMILLTPCIISPTITTDAKALAASKARAAAAEKIVAEYVAIVRKVAGEAGYAVAENNALMREARAAGKRVMSADGIHPNYFGQSLMARSILDAMGYADVPLPKRFAPKLFPGVVRRWRMRLAPGGKALTEATAAALKPDKTWKAYTLPDPVPAEKPSAEDWWEQERRNGFGLKVHEKIGKGRVQAVAVIDAAKAKTAYVNVGTGVAAVWLNGKRVYQLPKGITGFHAGKDRAPVALKAGENLLVAEITGPQFFLSVTDKRVWEEDLR